MTRGETAASHAKMRTAGHKPFSFLRPIAPNRRAIRFHVRKPNPKWQKVTSAGGTALCGTFCQDYAPGWPSWPAIRRRPEPFRHKISSVLGSGCRPCGRSSAAIPSSITSARIRAVSRSSHPICGLSLSTPEMAASRQNHRGICRTPKKRAGIFRHRHVFGRPGSSKRIEDGRQGRSRVE